MKKAVLSVHRLWYQWLLVMWSVQGQVCLVGLHSRLSGTYYHHLTLQVRDTVTVQLDVN